MRSDGRQPNEIRPITIEPDFFLESVDTEDKKLVSYDEREIDYDLLVTIPLNMGADVIARSGLGNEMNYAAQKFARTVIGSNNIDSCNRT